MEVLHRNLLQPKDVLLTTLLSKDVKLNPHQLVPVLAIK
jgi:hypothetical protein